MKIGFIGCGNMATAIINGITNNNVVSEKDINAYDVFEGATKKLKENKDINICENEKDVVKSSDIIFLAVKPNVQASVLKAIDGEIKDKLIISIAAGKTIEFIESNLKCKAKIVRVMPNINAKVGEAISAYCFNDSVTGEDKTNVESLLNGIGQVLCLDESYFPLFGVIGGCGPAFAYMFIDAMARAGVKNGMKKSDALKISAQTVLGSAKMILESEARKEKFWGAAGGADQLFTEDNVFISSDGTTHTVTLTYPDPLIDTESDVKFKAQYGSKTIEKAFKVEDPELTLSLKNGDADVWATKAYVKVEASAKSRASRTISSSTVEIQYKDGEVWKVWPNQSYDSEKGLFLLTGMGEGATDTNGVAYTLRAAYKRSGEVVTYSGELPIITEAKTQIPNSGFDDWYTDSKEQWSVGLFKNIKWFFYYPFQQGDEGHWWSTNNERAQAWTVAPVYVTTCPAVIYTYDTRTGEGKAAEIHTSGSGGEYASTSTSMYPKSAFAGSIFIGSYSWSDKSEHKSLGHSFNTRPLGLSFWYKYKPYKTDAFKVLVEVKSGETVIAAGEYVPEAYSSEDLEYQQHTISLEYTNSLLKATSISVQFLSTNKTSFTENDLQKNGTLTLTDCADSWNAHFGSFLKIDDVELIYE